VGPWGFPDAGSGVARASAPTGAKNEAMFRIGDFSKLSQVTVKALRLYDERGLLRPARVDRASGYRFYTAGQLSQLQRIVALKDLGFSLQEIAGLLEDGPSVEEIRGMLRLKRAELERDLAAGRERLARVETRLAELEREGVMPDYEVIIKSAPALRIASVRDVVPTYADVGRLYEELCGQLMPRRVPLAGPFLTIDHSGEYRERDVDLEAAAPLAGPLPDSLSGARVRERQLAAEPTLACTVHQGPFEELHRAYGAMMRWIETNGYRITGPGREVFLKAPGPGVAPAEYVTEIQLPVAKGAVPGE
jgi:DNA-binding transcriptional MerR regulator